MLCYFPDHYDTCYEPLYRFYPEFECLLVQRDCSVFYLPSVGIITLISIFCWIGNSAPRYSIYKLAPYFALERVATGHGNKSV